MFEFATNDALRLAEIQLSEMIAGQWWNDDEANSLLEKVKAERRYRGIQRTSEEKAQRLRIEYEQPPEKPERKPDDDLYRMTRDQLIIERDRWKRLLPDKDIQEYIEDIEWVLEEKRDKIMKRVMRNRCGTVFEGPIDTVINIPGDVVQSAFINADQTEIGLLALSRPGGDIMPPDHWLHDRYRDEYTSMIGGMSMHEWGDIFRSQM